MPLSPRPILALDTGVGASACLCLPDGSVFSATMKTPRAHSRELLPLLQNLLQTHGINWQDLQAFAVSTGPGSFTGLRVACATIAGLNASLHKPVFGLSSLAITALQADTSAPIWAIEDARSGLVYAAQYEKGQCLSAPQCLSWQEFLSLKPSAYISISDVPVALDDWDVLPVELSREQALIQAVSAIPNTAEHALWVEPLYLQVSQAE